jgi:hypothetical protein
MSDRDALNETVAAVRFELLFTRDDDTAGRMALLLEDIDRLRDNPRKSRTFLVKPHTKGWVQ